MSSSEIKFSFYAMARYHYNVADTRLAQHVEKGNEDGLFISSVAILKGPRGKGHGGKPKRRDWLGWRRRCRRRRRENREKRLLDW